MATVAQIAEALEYRYHTKQVEYLANDEVVFWENMRKKEKRIDGRPDFILQPIVNQRVTSAGVGTPEGGALISPTQPDHTEATLNLQEYQGIYDVTWRALDQAKRSEAAFINLTRHMDELTLRPFLRSLNADLLSDGRGKLFELSAADNNATISNLRGIPLVEVGDVVDVMDDSDDDTKLANSVTVNAVNLNDPTAPTLTLSAAPASTAAGDYGCKQDTTDDSLNDAQHSHGVLGVVNNADPPTVVGDYANIDRGTAGNEFFESPVLGNSGTNRSLTEDLLLQGSDAARLKGGGRIDKWFTNQAIARRYHEIIRGETYITMQPGESLHGGVGRKGQGEAARKDGRTVYHIGGTPVYVDPFWRAFVMIGIDSRNWWIGHGSSMVPQPISKIFSNVPFFKETTNMTFEVVWYYLMQLLCDNPAGQVRINDLAHT